MVNIKKGEIVTNKLSNNHFEYKGKDDLKSLTTISDFERQYNYAIPSPQEVIEDLITMTKESIKDLDYYFNLNRQDRTDDQQQIYNTKRFMLKEQITYYLFLFEDLNKGELEYDIAREGSE